MIFIDLEIHGRASLAGNAYIGTNSSPMKLPLVFLLAFLVATLVGCKPGEPDPQDTLDDLVEAIRAKDIAAYEALWYPSRAEDEAQASKLKADPGMWDELQSMFKGSHTLVEEAEREEDGKRLKKFDVKSPDVPEGDGIGIISMILDGDRWKMYSW